MTPRTTPTLLLMAEYNGTLAAARCLSARGTPVILATSRLLAVTRWSNAVARVEPCPPIEEGPDSLAAWLVEFGKRHPKHVLYPTSDELAWLIAHHRSELAPYYHLYSPGPETLRTLLDKRALYQAANGAGIETPRTWHPRDEQELPAILQAAGACLIKPRAQAYFRTGAKGSLARTVDELTALWREYRAAGYATEIMREIGDMDLPMIQEYLPEASDEVTSISGFAVHGGEIIDTRGSRKVLQMPRHAGVGLCFEDAEVPPALVRRLSQLFRNIGYHGVFEVEFVRHGGRDLMIDFNPRYYGQVGFDIARGLELPWLAQLCAIGREQEARRFARRGRHASRPAYFADSVALRWHLLVGTILGALTRAERRRWRSWLASRPGQMVDAVVDPRDKVPAYAAAAARLWHAVRHPRGLWRGIRRRPVPAERNSHRAIPTDASRSEVPALAVLGDIALRLLLDL